MTDKGAETDFVNKELTNWENENHAPPKVVSLDVKLYCWKKDLMEIVEETRKHQLWTEGRDHGIYLLCLLMNNENVPTEVRHKAAQWIPKLSSSATSYAQFMDSQNKETISRGEFA